ncbi:F0F1 ATP synthase subunit C [Pseudomonas sp. PCH446]
MTPGRRDHGQHDNYRGGIDHYLGPDHRHRQYRPALGEGRAVATALSALAQQPDASATITRTLFVGLAMVESVAIYCFVVSMILIFANPFWSHAIAQVAGK